MDISLTMNDSKGMATARQDGKRMGAMTFSIAGPQLIIIDHTEVEPEAQGAGVGKQLLLKVVEMAREQSRKIMPLCPFANAMFKRDASLRDVLQ